MPLIKTEKKIREPENLADKFIVNPFSVLRKTTGVWQDRKHYWVNMGIASNEGRDIVSIFYNSSIRIAYRP